MGKKLDLTGQKYGRLTVISEAPKKNGRIAWYCQCDCGNTTTVTTHDLRSGNTKSCGCYFKDRAVETHRINEVGNRYGKLTVLRYAFTHNGDVWWHCKCDCGNETDVMAYALRSGHTKSCGCLKEQSYGSYLIEKYLQTYNYQYKKEVTFKEFYSDTPNHMYRFDFGIYKDNKLYGLIEFDGRQHFNEGMSNRFTPVKIKEIQNRDNIKNQYCVDNNIPLLRIKYTEIKNINTILEEWLSK